MYILFDIGKTKMRIAGARTLDTFDEPVIVNTPEDFEEMVSVFSSTAKSLTGEGGISAVVGGIGAPLSKDKTQIIGSRFAGKPFKSLVEKELGAPVYLENDANMAGLGEAVHGSGKDFDAVAYITVSTGVGGARIVQKKMDSVSAGFQPGQDVIDFEKNSFGGNDTGTLEELISGKDIEKRIGKKAYEIPQDDEVWEKLARALAYGLNDVAVYWRPDVIVLGGSMITGNPSISIEKTEEYLKGILKVFREMPEIKKASLGDIGGIYGALEYAKQQGIN